MNTEKKNKRECNGISIILATYNRKNLIEKAINSILNRKASYDINYEIVVAVDGSTDGTYDFLKVRYKNELSAKIITIIELEHTGQSHARNQGVAHARYDWICYVDDDNVVKDNFLDVFYQAIINNPDSDFFYARHLLSTFGNCTEHEFDRHQLLRWNFIDGGVICHSKNLFSLVGGFDENLTRFEDWDLIIKLSGRTEPIYIPEIILDYDSDTNRSRISNTVSEADNIAKIRSKVKIEVDLYNKIENEKINLESRIENEKNNLESRIENEKNDFKNCINNLNEAIEETNRATCSKFENDTTKIREECQQIINKLNNELKEQTIVISSMITIWTLLKYKFLKSITFGRTHKRFRDIYKKLRQIKKYINS